MPTMTAAGALNVDFVAKTVASTQEPVTGDPARDEERYALAMQSINYAVYDADLEGGEVYFSEGACATCWA